MSPRPVRSRLLDLAVATACVACVCAPLLPTVAAAPNAAVVESGGSVDQKVLQSGWISNPLDGSFESGTRGTLDGTFSWSQFTTRRTGAKLVLSSDRSPAMRDSNNGIDIADYGASPVAWTVGGSDRKFGFTVLGAMSLNRFGDGKNWRGFDGKEGIEVARRSSAFGSLRTTIKVRAEFGSALASDGRPTANIRATALPNL